MKKKVRERLVRGGGVAGRHLKKTESNDTGLKERTTYFDTGRRNWLAPCIVMGLASGASITRG